MGPEDSVNSDHEHRTSTSRARRRRGSSMPRTIHFAPHAEIIVRQRKTTRSRSAAEDRSSTLDKTGTSSIVKDQTPAINLRRNFMPIFDRVNQSSRDSDISNGQNTNIVPILAQQNTICQIPSSISQFQPSQVTRSSSTRVTQSPSMIVTQSLPTVAMQTQPIRVQLEVALREEFRQLQADQFSMQNQTIHQLCDIIQRKCDHILNGMSTSYVSTPPLYSNANIPQPPSSQMSQNAQLRSQNAQNQTPNVAQNSANVVQRVSQTNTQQSTLQINALARENIHSQNAPILHTIENAQYVWQPKYSIHSVNNHDLHQTSNVSLPVSNEDGN